MSDKCFGGQVGVGDEPLLGTSGWGDMSMLGHGHTDLLDGKLRGQLVINGKTNILGKLF